MVTRRDWLAGEFERHRGHLRAVGYRMLGSVSEAEDAVQEAWLRLDRSDPGGTDDLRGWLTVVVGRICLDTLRRRQAHPEQLSGSWLPEPVVYPQEMSDPESSMVTADSVGLALLVVLETLSPPERLAFVLHDMFAVPFDEIAPIVERSPEATRQLASRARRRVQGERTAPDPDLDRQRVVVQAFLAASREGDFDALVAVLDPDVVVRADFGGGRTQETRGAEAVAGQAQMYARLGLVIHPALVNGAVGAVTTRDGRPFSVGAITVREGKIVEMDFLADPERLAALDLTILDG